MMWVLGDILYSPVRQEDPFVLGPGASAFFSYMALLCMLYRFSRNFTFYYMPSAHACPLKRLVASGRGEYLPVDPRKTDEARQKNRRTEIILTPTLDELLKILESN